MSSLTFRKWLYGKPTDQIEEYKAKILAKAVITDVQYRNYVSERSVPTLAVQEAINKIAGQTLFYPRVVKKPKEPRRKKYSTSEQSQLFEPPKF
tara:strand:- start:137 stop:418 length:282 start_codon:yes stop_codon:yes gene_type:complete